MSLSLRGRDVAEQLKSSIQAEVIGWKNQDVEPRVVTILVEGDPASEYYAKSKGRVARQLGIEYEILHFSRKVSEEALRSTVQKLNRDDSVHGIMIELPLPSHINTLSVTEMIEPHKDVDGLTRANRHANITGEQGIYPATPLAAVRLLKHYGFSPSGKHVALVGFGQTVGQPLFHVLVRENATVTVCHAGTPDISRHTLASDIIFVAVGKAGLITEEMVHDRHVIVDAGINQISGNEIVGDVDPLVAGKVRAMSPTPGGVGTVTTMQLFANLMTALSWQQNLGLLDLTAVGMA
ncbi:bifunctional 5,10-methylenetetrahydrofolate dehydrogenase/5,10-methenyltetrahydrofolate cyclohydrolase [Alicyclobacillus ferrooxydans]|uniref:Bifunctional protein FolD n=1 Tax=Alicyclobacillus ferrooxydans TaxID=471514 RepID=A0A0P9C8Z9_9BACL|nr:bifunctional 5,10-methylenetetrahydrofolate dehydrogenase/5,10-methenyltetrahydrofolate cyclohydrolase [Alicyclobacillus ferrooxydans]KPV41808.1 methenyltetrahydrofolate cyclohydrolase [Alicyclobacillus ferrooxydans]